MKEFGTFAALIVMLFAGMLFAFGLVLIYLFFTPGESLCHAELDTIISSIL